MNKIALSLAAASALTLAACSDKAQNETGEAANVVATDVANTTEAGVNSVDNALDAAGNTMENAAEETGEQRDGDRSGAQRIHQRL